MNKILVISSPSPIRQQNVKDQFAKQNGDWKDSYELVPAVMMATCRYGISRSFKKCVEMAKARGWKYCVICEDDINFLSPDSLRIYFQTLIKAPEFDILAAGLFSGELKDPDTVLGYSQVKGNVSGFHLIAIHHSFYDKFLSTDESTNIDFSVTSMPGVKYYVAVPILVSEISGYSFNSGKEANYSQHLCLKYKCISFSNQ